MKHLKQILEKNGFTQKEAEIYFALLRTDTAPASEVARESGMNRLTTYDILKRLIERGYVSTAQKRGVTQYTALSPDRLFQLIQKNVDEFKDNVKQFLDIKQTSYKKPKVTFFEGTAGLRHVYNDFMSHHDIEVLTVTSATNLYDALGKKFIHDTYTDRARKNIVVKSLNADSPLAMKEMLYNKKASRVMRLYPDHKYNIPNEIDIYADKVALMSFTDQIAVIIENKEIAESMRNLWKMAWDRFK